MTIKETLLFRLATIGAIIAPSLCPISPITPISFLLFKNSIALTTSEAKSLVVAEL